MTCPHSRPDAPHSSTSRRSSPSWHQGRSWSPRTPPDRPSAWSQAACPPSTPHGASAADEPDRTNHPETHRPTPRRSTRRVPPRRPTQLPSHRARSLATASCPVPPGRQRQLHEDEEIAPRPRTRRRGRRPPLPFSGGDPGAPHCGRHVSTHASLASGCSHVRSPRPGCTKAMRPCHARGRTRSAGRGFRG